MNSKVFFLLMMLVVNSFGGSVDWELWNSYISSGGTHESSVLLLRNSLNVQEFKAGTVGGSLHDKGAVKVAFNLYCSDLIKTSGAQAELDVIVDFVEYSLGYYNLEEMSNAFHMLSKLRENGCLSSINPEEVERLISALNPRFREQFELHSRTVVLLREKYEKHALDYAEILLGERESVYGVTEARLKAEHILSDEFWVYAMKAQILRVTLCLRDREIKVSVLEDLFESVKSDEYSACERASLAVLLRQVERVGRDTKNSYITSLCAGFVKEYQFIKDEFGRADTVFYGKEVPEISQHELRELLNKENPSDSPPVLQKRRD